MGTTDFIPGREAAIRSLILEYAATAPKPAPARRHRWWVGAGIFAGAGLIGGVGAAAAGFFTEPGADIVTEIAAPAEGDYTGTQTIELGPAPEGATHIFTELTCLSTGTLYWEDGASMGCGADDIESWPALYTMPLQPGQHSTEIRTSAPDVRYRLMATYVNQTPTEWAVNENGDTYGAVNAKGEPDLVSVIATHGKLGYAYSKDLRGPEINNPQEAMEYMETMKGTTLMVPVYESDGETVIGEFQAGSW
jgi:hypothetical protein